MNLSIPKSNTPEVGSPENAYRASRKMYKNPHPVIYKEYTGNKEADAVGSELEHLYKIKHRISLEPEDIFLTDFMKQFDQAA